MELDLTFELPVPKPWERGLREEERTRINNAIEQVQLADRLGFKTAWFVEHHFREARSHCSAPEVLIGALSRITNDIRLGFGVTLMPHGFGHPVRVAEKVAMCDVVANGRVEWGTGRSTPGEQAPFNVPVGEESREQWEDAVRSCVAAWHEEPFSWDSKHLKFSPPRPILPKPVQYPHPPAWVACVSEGSAARAGRQGLGMLSFSVLNPLETCARHIYEYRRAAMNPEPITDVVTNQVSTMTLVHCAESNEKVVENGTWDEIWWWYRQTAEIALQFDFPHFTEEQKNDIFPLLRDKADGKFDVSDFSKHDMVIVGDPETCLTKAKRYADAGADRLLCYCEFGNMSHESVMTSIELLGKEVLPELKEYKPDPNAFPQYYEAVAESSAIGGGWIDAWKGTNRVEATS